MLKHMLCLENVYNVSHFGEVRGAGVEPLRGGSPPHPLCNPLR